MYRPLSQQSNLGATIAIRTRTAPSALAAAIGREVRAVDPSEPVFAVRPMEQVVARATAERRFAMVLVAIFAVAALLLAAIGIYAVMTYAVGQRAREIGIRVALGARTADVFRNVVASGLGVVAVGVGLGLAGSVLVAGFLGDALFGVSTHDAGVLSLVTVVLVATAVLANGLPARRAARIDPMRSLRTE